MSSAALTHNGLDATSRDTRATSADTSADTARGEAEVISSSPGLKREGRAEHRASSSQKLLTLHLVYPKPMLPFNEWLATCERRPPSSGVMPRRSLKPKKPPQPHKCRRMSAKDALKSAKPVISNRQRPASRGERVEAQRRVLIPMHLWPR